MVLKYINSTQKILKYFWKIWKILKNLKDFPADKMKNAQLHKYVYDFSVDYDSINVDDILDIHKYLMVKGNLK